MAQNKVIDRVPYDIKGFKDLNIDLISIWGQGWGMTFQLQVLDIIANKPFKDHFKMKYN